MAILALAPADLARLVGLAAGDTSADVSLTALLASEQAALEYTLDPGIVTQAVAQDGLVPGSGALPLLTLGAAEVLAGRYLEQLGRFPHVAEPLPLGSLNVQAAVVLAVAVADLKRLLAVEPGDTSQDDGLSAWLASEQLAVEYGLDASVLAAAVSVITPNAGLEAVLTLGVSEVLAGAYLAAQGRIPGQGVDVAIASLHFTTHSGPLPDKLGGELLASGLSRLAPYSRSVRAEHRLKPVLNQPDLLKIGRDLSAHGAARLAPFLRAKRAAAVAASGPAPDDDSPVPLFPVAEAGPSVFDASFSENSYRDLADMTAAEGFKSEGEGMVLWGASE